MSELAFVATSLLCDASSKTCIDRLGEGAACNSADQCLPGLDCIAQGMDRVCASGPEGRACDNYAAPCPKGLFCNDMRVCQSPGMNGTYCNGDDQCVPSQYCAPGRGSGTGCTPKGQLGADCWIGKPCAAGLYCDEMSRKCAADVALGQMCMDDPPFGPQCTPGAYCVYDPMARQQACKPQAQAGERCDTPKQCTSGGCAYDPMTGASTCLATTDCIRP